MTEERVERNGDRLASAGVGLAAIAITAVGGSSVFFLGTPLTTLAPLAGVIAALACTSLFDSMLVAGIGALLGSALVLVASSLRPASIGPWLARAALIALVAAVVAGVVSWMVTNTPRYRKLIAALGVVLVIGSGWLYATSMSSAIQPAAWVTGVPGSSMPITRALITQPTFTAESSDETIFLALVQRLTAGEDFYAASVATLAQTNRVHPDERVPLNLSTSYRMPALYWLLSRAPQDGISLVLFALILQLLATASAYVLARRYVTTPLALAGATCVSAYFARFAISPSILYVELWAGGLGLVAVTLFIASRARPKNVWVLQVASVVFALAAALFRELAVAFLLVGLVATLTDRDCRKARLWALWVAGLVAFVGAYALHIRAVFSALAASGIADTTAQASSRVPWLHPDGLGLAAAVTLLSGALALGSLAAWGLYLAGLAGAGLAPRDTASRVVLLAVTFGGSAVLMLMRPGGETSTGAPIGYWGLIVLPTVIACMPLVFSRLRVAQQGEPVETAGSSVSVPPPTQTLS